MTCPHDRRELTHLALDVAFLPHIQQFVHDTIGRRYKLILSHIQLLCVRCLHLVIKRSNTPDEQRVRCTFSIHPNQSLKRFSFVTPMKYFSRYSL